MTTEEQNRFPFYLISVPHQRPAFDNIFDSSDDLISAAIGECHKNSDDPDQITDDESAIGYLTHDLHHHEIIETANDAKKLQSRCQERGSTIHQRARISAICDDIIDDIFFSQ